jgi:Fe-S-cluster containining protein
MRLRPEAIDRHLTNYRALVARVDELCRRIESAFAKELACRRGCDGCCRHLTLLPVEAYALARALAELPAAEAEAIRARARAAAADGPCPLLAGGECLLYAARPLICRSHGLPLLIEGEQGRRIDFCPENFRGIAELPGAAVIDLERLNAALAAIDHLFVAEALGGDAAPRRRLTLAGALLLELR